MSRGRRDSGPRFDELSAMHTEPILQVCPVLVVANDVTASERLRHAQPAAQLGDERTALELFPFQEGMKSPLERELFEQISAQELHEPVSEEPPMDFRRHAGQSRVPDPGPVRRYPFEPHSDVAGHLEGSEGVGGEVRITENMHVSSAPVRCYGDVE